MTELMRRPALDSDARLTGLSLIVMVEPLQKVGLLAVWPNRLNDIAERLAGQGLCLPDSIGAVGEGSEGAALAIAPGRWLILSQRALPDLPAEMGAVTDLSHARVAVRIEGGDALALASKLAPVDFDLPRHGSGSVIQTGSGHTIPITLWRRSAECFVILSERSYASSLWQAIADEGAEFGLTVQSRDLTDRI